MAQQFLAASRVALAMPHFLPVAARSAGHTQSGFIIAYTVIPFRLVSLPLLKDRVHGDGLAIDERIRQLQHAQ